MSRSSASAVGRARTMPQHDFDRAVYAARFVAELEFDLSVDGYRVSIFYHWTDDDILVCLVVNHDTGQEVLFEVWPRRSGFMDGVEANVAAAERLVLRHTTKKIERNPAFVPKLIERPRIPW